MHGGKGDRRKLEAPKLFVRKVIESGQKFHNSPGQKLMRSIDFCYLSPFSYDIYNLNSTFGLPHERAV